MSEAYVAVGSNQNAPANIRAALQHLRTRYGELRISPAYESADASGSGAQPYVNLVVNFETILAAGQLLSELRDIERICGRDRGAETAACPLDLDLLLIGSAVVNDGPLRLPHPELAQRAYMLRPLVDLAGDMTHPSLGLSFTDLWDKLGGQHQSLRRFSYPLG